MYVYIHVDVYMYLCMGTYVCIYMYIHTCIISGCTDAAWSTDRQTPILLRGGLVEGT